jgi:NADH dehydrogenase
MAEATDVDLSGRKVILADGVLSYDYLVVATGVRHAYFGHEEWGEHAQGLKTVDDALEIRRRFLLAFEAAEREADTSARQRLLTFVVVGGGPTGVELAGAMAEIARKVIPRDFRFIDTRTARILLLEGSSKVLPTYPEVLSEKARRQLERLGVEVRTNALVTTIEPEAVRVGDERIEAGNVLWAAGVLASPIGACLGARDRSGRVLVGPDLSLTDHPEVFVVGDLAHAGEGSSQVPGVAQGAMQGGRHAARQIARDLEKKSREPFQYWDKGNLATIGRAAAVADLGRVRLSGLIAWLVWVFVHILYLIGFRNRIVVMIQWAWAYLMYQRGIRLITGGVTPQLELPRNADAREGAIDRA